MNLSALTLFFALYHILPCIKNQDKTLIPHFSKNILNLGLCRQLFL